MSAKLYQKLFWNNRVMATAVDILTLAQFEQRFGDEKPYYEFWEGTAIQKSMPTWVHGLLQVTLAELLHRLGLYSASEVRIKINSSLELVPDIIASNERVREVYATRPPAVAIEILSPGDSAQLLWKKCGIYANWGIPRVYVIDPDARKVRFWNHELDSFSNVTEIRIDPYGAFPTSLIWEELDKQIEL